MHPSILTEEELLNFVRQNGLLLRAIISQTCTDNCSLGRLVKDWGELDRVTAARGIQPTAVLHFAFDHGIQPITITELVDLYADWLRSAEELKGRVYEHMEESRR